MAFMPCSKRTRSVGVHVDDGTYIFSTIGGKVLFNGDNEKKM
ncbi:hypothetical protein OAO87_04000 [bacterium]|nr:hypothetical protein [bacterium]